MLKGISTSLGLEPGFIAAVFAGLAALAASLIIVMALVAVFSSNDVRSKRAMQIFRALLSFFRGRK